MEQLYWFWKGYVFVHIYGSYPERFFNLCKNRGILIKRLERTKTYCSCSMLLRDYKLLRPIARKAHCFPKIMRKQGLPFLICKIKDRKGFVFGVLLSAFILWQCSIRIWNIEIEGGFLHTKEQMSSYLEEQNIYAGIHKEKINCFELEKSIRLSFPDIGWISAQVKGTNLYIKLNEAVMPSTEETMEGFYHIVAANDGLVEKISVRAGTPKVKKGDYVKKGEILISGILPIVGDNEELIRNQPIAAKGEVVLISDFSYREESSLCYRIKKTRKQQEGIQISIFGKKLFSYIPRYSGRNYDIITFDVQPVMFGEFRFPLKIRKYQVILYDEHKETYTKEQAVGRAQKRLQNFLSDWKNQQVEILSENITFQVDRTLCVASGIITAKGNFISYQEISEEEWRKEDEHSRSNP